MEAAVDDNDGDRLALIGRTLASRYRIETLLGSGAMGQVYRARHVKVGRPFAVKILHHRLLADPRLRQRFEREAQLAGRLHHKNIAGVVDVGETDDGVHYMVMEYADGKTLAQTIAGPMPGERVIRIVQQLCDGLAHAHEAGMIHRDFKPDNVIIEVDASGKETPRIIDFGIALLSEAQHEAQRLTSGGIVLGTPQYMPPEHALGLELDHRVDLFALGVICYEMLTGQLPFDGTGVEVARANMSRETPAMGVRVPFLAVDPLLERFTRRLMAKRRDDRPANARAARELLDLIETDRDAAARALGLPSAEPLPVTRTEPLKTPIATSRELEAIAPPRGRWLWIGAAAALAIAVGAVVVMRGHDASPASPAPAPASMPAPASTTAAMPRAASMPAATSPHGSIAAPTSSPSASPSTSTASRTRQHVATSGSATAAGTKPSSGASGSGAAPANPHGLERVQTPIHQPAAVVPLTPPPTVPTVAADDAAAIVRLYAQVGRDLKALDNARGSAATTDLWPRYLRVRINDVITTPDKRKAASTLLGALHDEIATRAH